MLLSQVKKMKHQQVFRLSVPKPDFPPVPGYYRDASVAFSETGSQSIFRSAAFLLFSGCFLPLIITIKRCPSFSICRNFLTASPQPTWVSPEHMQHSLFNGSFHCFQGRRIFLLELRLYSTRFSFHKVCSCLDRHAGRQLLVRSNITQPWSGIVCQFCTDNK